jgi:hypothetical protein
MDEYVPWKAYNEVMAETERCIQEGRRKFRLRCISEWVALFALVTALGWLTGCGDYDEYPANPETDCQVIEHDEAGLPIHWRCERQRWEMP